jgi:hypothetical protein
MSILNPITIRDITPKEGLVSFKTSLKSIHGQLDLEECEKNIDGLIETRYKLNLQLKNLKPEVAEEIIRVLTPFFKDPISPQLQLFPEPTMTTLPFKKDE